MGTKNGQGKNGKGVLVVSKNGREYYHYADRKRERYGSAVPDAGPPREPVRSLADHPLVMARDATRARQHRPHAGATGGRVLRHKGHA